MRIVAFIVDPENSNADVDPDELHLDYDTFPIKGDLIIHDDVRYRVTDRYIISHSEQPKFRAARTQYTLELVPLTQEYPKPSEDDWCEVTQIQVQRDVRAPGLLQVKGIINGEEVVGTVAQDPGPMINYRQIADELVAKWKQTNK